MPEATRKPRSGVRSRTNKLNVAGAVMPSDVGRGHESRVRVPPCRVGRLWLARRLAIAKHAGELLKQKLAILNHEEQRLAQRAAHGAAEWRRLCAESEMWRLRAAVLSSRRALRIASGGTTACADIEMGFTIGIEHPVSGAVRLKKQQDLPVAGSAAVTEAAEAACAAVEAALSAAVGTALRTVQAEMATTRRTLRAVEQPWIPRLSTALAEVRLELVELEHAEGVRHRWAAQQGGR
jgi:V/A-type H+-transporting ATPase subunit D